MKQLVSIDKLVLPDVAAGNFRQVVLRDVAAGICR